MDGFLEKNKDLLYPDAIRMLAASKSSVLRSLFERWVLVQTTQVWALESLLTCLPIPVRHTATCPCSRTARSAP